MMKVDSKVAVFVDIDQVTWRMLKLSPVGCLKNIGDGTVVCCLTHLF